MKFILSIPWIVLAGMWAAALYVWPNAPDTLPVHWNYAGEPDRWGGKVEGLLLLPGITTLALAFFLVLPKVDPGRANWPQMRGAWAGFQIAFVLLLAALYAGTLGALTMQTALPRLLGLFLAVLGALMGKVRPNWFFGIRTPWTLTSKRAWIRTHRYGGFAFLGLGVLGLGLSVVSPTYALGVVLGGLLLSTVVLVAYSWTVWRHDPDRTTPAGTHPE